MSKLDVRIDKQGIRIGPGPEELARRQARAKADAVAKKSNVTLADVRDLLLLVLEALQRLEVKMGD